MKRLVKEKLYENSSNDFSRFEENKIISQLKGFHTNIEQDTLSNNNFRKVLYTAKNMQLVLMTLQPGEDIGEEVHLDNDQFFRIEEGNGLCIINDNEYEISDDDIVIIPQGSNHNIINTGKKPLRMYTIYAPPHHLDTIVHTTKEEAEANDEDFNGKTTE